MPTASHCHGSPDDLLLFLADHDSPCPGCTYNLRGQTRDRCPECGITISLKALKATRRNAPFVVGLVGIVLGFLTNSVLSVVIIVLFAPFVKETAGAGLYLFLTLLGVAVDVCVLVLWVRLQPRVARLRRSRHWFLALSTYPIAVGNIIAAFLLDLIG